MSGQGPTSVLRTAAATRSEGGQQEALVLALLAVLVAVVADYPILGVYFHDDDFLQLLRITDSGPGSFITQAEGGHMCLVSNSIFYVAFLLFGTCSTAYLAVMLVTHIANVALLFALIRCLTDSARLACFGALIFTVCPANDGTLGWFAVHGHALAGTFTLAALLLLVSPGNDSRPLSTRAAVGAACCLLAASQSFGTGTAAALIIPLVATLLRPSALRGAAGVALGAVPVLVLTSFFALYATPTNFNPDPMGTLVSLATVAADWRHVVPMTGHIAALGIVSLVLGPAYPLDRYPDAVSTGTLAGFAIAVLWALARGSTRTRRTILALLALYLACYVTIAAGRATLFAALRRADLLHGYARSTRYHYLAQAVLAVVICLVLAEASRRRSWTPLTRDLLLSAWTVWAMASATVLRLPIKPHDDARAAVARQRERIALEVRKQPPGSTVCVPNQPGPPILGFPGSAGVFMIDQRGNELEGRRVYFVSSDPTLLAWRETGGRLGSLLLPPGACPPHQAGDPG